MRTGIQIIEFNWPGGAPSIAPTIEATARAAETAGISSLAVMDHLFQMDAMAPATDPMLEGYTTLGFLAGCTETMSLGLLVTGATYRYPGLLAKIVATLDVLSGGRAVLGLGAGWYEREHRGLGVPFPPLAERFERLEETIQICRQMWSDDDGRFDGRHYQLAETICEPRPISQPRPRVMIGGSGERKTLRLVARYADACNLSLDAGDAIARKLDVLATHCEAEGRDPAAIERTLLYLDDPFADLDAFTSAMEQFAALGIDRSIVTARGDPVSFVERLGADVVPRLADL